MILTIIVTFSRGKNVIYQFHVGLLNLSDGRIPALSFKILNIV